MDDEPLPAPLPGDVERTPLPERVVPYWQLTSGITWFFVCVIPVGIAIAVPGLPTIARAALVLVPLLLAVFDVAVVQPKRRAIWWYAVGDEQIDLQHGWPIVTRTVVPITRVQHVALEQGPLARRFTLAHLSIHTAAGAVKIPALDDAEGHRIRQRIADLARIAD
ncbi:MAG: PH domain-containing protein, partial [Solirubrobacteraceae bacterium]|nr:PH domain-containing protein [Solirubrobacteraceae bacterium]